MANTMFYKAVDQNVGSITWKNIFSEFRNKHTKQDMEYAMLAGTSLDTADEGSMLNKWRKPWLFYRLLIISAIIAAVLIVPMIMFGGIFGMNAILVYTVCPMLIPLVLMVFFWELNIPRNISIYEMVMFLLVGAFVSFLATGVMWDIVPYDDTASWAALREEPAKLAGTVAIFYYLSKKKHIKLYGLTGLAIGAAVGTGFSAFESIEYGINYGIFTVIARMVYAVVGHTMYCAPYSAALALNTKNGKMSWDAFLSKDFLITFGASVFSHALWNSGYLPSGIGVVVKGVILWGATLWILRKCLKQIVDVGKAGFVPSGVNGQLDSGIGYPEKKSRVQWLIAHGGVMNGRVYQIGQQEITLGRDPSNTVCYPGDTRGVSRFHAKVFTQNGVVYLMDCGSSAGTYLDKGVFETLTLATQGPIELEPEDVFWLGDPTNQFKVSL